MYHDNIQEYVSQAAAANFNQANSGYRPSMVSNQIRPPGFPPVQNPHANSQNNFNRGNNFNQNRGNNFNQGQIYRPPVHQPVVNQPVAHQGPAPQTHAVFVVLILNQNPEFPLISGGRCILENSHALIDVYEGEITLRVGKEAITFNPGPDFKYTADYDHMTANKIDVFEMDCVSILKSEHHPPSQIMNNICLEVGKNSKLCEAKTVESSVNEPPEVELKELPPHLILAFSWFLSPQASHRLDNSPTLRVLGQNLYSTKFLWRGLWNLCAKSKEGHWVSPVHCVLKGWYDRITNDENELIPTRLVTGWRMLSDFASGGSPRAKKKHAFSAYYTMLARTHSVYDHLPSKYSLLRKDAKAKTNAVDLIAPEFA
ncbi:hypothetical protein Tco_0804824 [Tanacetum coccineum]|uniref:Uncharacterized protein n=1 Tax=Tanacetum coccineum TaxID=301880 RepID=A0ABQ5A7Y9_9ASTR